MKRRNRLAWIVAAATFACWTTAVPAATSRPTTMEELRTVLIQIDQRIAAGDYVQAGRLLESILVSPMFGELDANVQRDMVRSAGFLQLQAQEYERSHELFLRLTGMQDFTADDWLGRTFAARAADKEADALFSLATLARKFPASLAELEPQFIHGLLHDTRRLAGQEATRLDLMNALFDASWKPYGLDEPGYLLVELVEASLESGNRKRAMEVARRVTDPESIIRMRADRVFDEVTRDMKGQLDVTAASEARLRRLRAGLEKSPRSARILHEVILTLLQLRRPDEALAIADDALSRIARAEKGQPAFDELEEMGVWIKDSRARALKRLGRHEEALAQLVEASKELEDGHPNVSQAINSGGLYCDLGRPDEALAAIAPVTPDRVSAYGAMQVHSVRHCAAIKKKDAEGAREALEYLETHKSDDLRTYMSALIEQGSLDRAAEILIARLGDPQERADALLEVQDYTRAPGTSFEMEWRARWKEVLARADVRAAVEKVGRIETYAVERLF
jgi:tetratricopeptide (TPR) repeat protein